MMNLCSEVIKALSGKTIATAESCTGGWIGKVLTSVPGSSAVYKGGIVCYCNEIKQKLLGVDAALLDSCGAVSADVAKAMALAARKSMNTDVAVSVTGLAGPGGDDFGNPVGTVFIGYSDESITTYVKFLFSGDRDSVRKQAVHSALMLVLEKNV